MRRYRRLSRVGRGHTGTVRALPHLREDHGTGRTPLERALPGPRPGTADRFTAAGAV